MLAFCFLFAPSMSQLSISLAVSRDILSRISRSTDRRDDDDDAICVILESGRPSHFWRET